MVTVESLQELTGYESGVLIYKDYENGLENAKGEAINWSGILGFPRLFGTSWLGLGETMTFVDITSNACEDIREYAVIIAELTTQLRDKDPLLEHEKIIDEVFESEKCWVVSFEQWN